MRHEVRKISNAEWAEIHKTRPLLVPPVEIQRVWYAAIAPICRACDEYKGPAHVVESAKIVVGVKCRKCTSCGSQTVGPLRGCPLGKFQRAMMSDEPIADVKKG